MRLLTIVCILLQVLDGILTAVGVTTLPIGLEAEGNILVKHAMQSIGVIPALVLIKGFGIFVLCKLEQIDCSNAPLFIICGIYTLSSIFWIFVLFRALWGIA